MVTFAHIPYMERKHCVKLKKLKNTHSQLNAHMQAYTQVYMDTLNTLKR